MICEYCDKEFKTLSSLNHHKKTAKYCLELQEKPIQEKPLEEKDICNFCNKLFCNKYVLSYHLDRCKNKKDLDYEKILKEKDRIIENKNKEILELTKEVARLSGKNEIYAIEQNSLLRIAEQPKNTTTNNSITNLAVYDPKIVHDRFLSCMENIKPEDIYDGQASIARIVAPCLVNDDGTKMIACTDKSRGVFAIRDKDGNINKDKAGEQLVQVIEPIASKKAEEILNSDNLKRSKSISLRIYKNNIKNLEEEIESYKNTLLGQPKNSSEWKNTMYVIENNEKQIKRLYDQIEKIESEGISEAPDNYEFIDDKLGIGVEDIKEMKTQSKKFMNGLKTIPDISN